MVQNVNKDQPNIDEKLFGTLGENYDFDTRDKLIAAVESATLADVQTFYDETVFSETRSRIVIQLKGQRYADQEFGSLDGGVVIEDVDQFHKDMPKQSF